MARQKFLETLYATVFWLASGLIVWLLILPLALISLPIILLKAVGQILFQQPQPNLREVERQSLTSKSNNPHAFDVVLNSLLLTTLVGIPAVIAAVISLQPTRILKGEPQEILPSKPVKTRQSSSPESVEFSMEE